MTTNVWLLSVDCPHCGEKRGYRCVEPSGRLRSHPHHVRAERARDYAHRRMLKTEVERKMRVIEGGQS